MGYRYFISYVIENGFGRCVVERKTKINSIEDIESIEKAICRNNGFDGVGITNYILME